MKFDKPTLITLTAPTCSGKTYLIEHLFKLGFDRIVGTTTRAPRPGEVDGVDYYFITREQGAEMEARGEFAETSEFRGNRYGVTHVEMDRKMNGDMPPIVILEPQGLEKFEKYCVENDYGIFKVFVSTPESVRLDRLNKRTVLDIQSTITEFHKRNTDCFGATVSHSIHSTVSDADLMKVIKTHSDRLMSITGDERLWLTKNTWDAIVSGEDVDKAISYINQGIKWRNSQNAQLNT